MTEKHTYLIRFGGELCIKSNRTRNFFRRRLVKNVQSALAGTGRPFKLNSRWSRLLVESDAPDLSRLLRRVFGIQSVSSVERRPWSDMADLLAHGEEIFRRRVTGRTFAVRARRTGDPRRIPFGSDVLERELGTLLRPYADGVDLKRPDVVARIEVHPDGAAYFFTDTVPAYGGLPVGVEGRAISLVSGGFDSAVASWQMLKRGVALDYVFFNLGGTAHLQGVLRVLQIVARDWSYGTRPLLAAIDFRPIVDEIQAKVERSLWQIVLKRQMARAGSILSARYGNRPLVTGEAIGQVSSQTLPNLNVIDRASTATILRPLVTSNKDEIVAQARAIGTFELSAAVDEYCAILPRKPATHTRLSHVLKEESRLDDSLLAELVEARAIYHLSRLEAEDLAAPHLETTAVEPEATVIDLRTRADYERWHYPGALHLEFGQALDGYRSFDTGQRYVLYCEVGLKSARLAEMMQEIDLDARHVPGGLPKVARLAAERPQGAPTPATG